MLYSEFIEHVGCRENDYNYQVFKDLEVLYMNSETSKEKIYDYGKKLVDNSPTEEEIREKEESLKRIKKLKEKIVDTKYIIKDYKETLEMYSNMDTSSYNLEYIRIQLKNLNQNLADLKSKLRFEKSFLN